MSCLLPMQRTDLQPSWHQSTASSTPFITFASPLLVESWTSPFSMSFWATGHISVRCFDQVSYFIHNVVPSCIGTHLIIFLIFVGHGGKLVEALGAYHQSSLSHEEISSSPAFLYAQDALYCLRRFFNDWEKNPDDMEGIAMSSPLLSFKVISGS
jgi:hypothetical protein